MSFPRAAVLMTSPLRRCLFPPPSSATTAHRLLAVAPRRTSSSKRMLQTQTYSSTTPPTEPPLPRNAGIASSITSPAVEHTSGGPPPPVPEPATASTLTKPKPEPASASTPTTPKLEPAKPSALTRRMRTRKAAMTLTPTAVSQLRTLMDLPTPQLIRVGVKNKGCSGLAYHLEYVDKPARFDEEVIQDGVRVLIDSKALFSIIGSEMDWVEDKLSARFVFTNPNVKDSCGCGESFSVG